MDRQRMPFLTNLTNGTKMKLRRGLFEMRLAVAIGIFHKRGRERARKAPPPRIFRGAGLLVGRVKGAVPVSSRLSPMGRFRQEDAAPFQPAASARSAGAAAVIAAHGAFYNSFRRWFSPRLPGTEPWITGTLGSAASQGVGSFFSSSFMDAASYFVWMAIGCGKRRILYQVSIWRKGENRQRIQQL